MPKNIIPSAWRGNLVPRGESVSASVGLAGAVVLACVMAAAAWWTLRTQRQSFERAAEDRLAVVGGLLVGGAESLLAGNDPGRLSALRRLVVESALTYQLDRCRILLPDGQILADASPKSATLKELPDSWPGAARSSADPRRPALVLNVPGRGQATLELAGSEQFAIASAWEALAGIGAIGAGSLLVLLPAYRLLRAKLMPLGAIREALSALERGETTSAALTLSSALGPEAGAWNALLDERETLRRRMLAEKAEQQLSTRTRGDGDLSGACDAMWHGLMLVDEHMRIKYVNGAAGVFLGAGGGGGVKREEMVGSELKRWIDDESVLATLRDMISGRSRGRQVVELRREKPTRAGEAGAGDRSGAAGGGGGAGGAVGGAGAGGAAWSGGVLRVSMRPVRRDDSAAAMLIIEDVTQQRAADEARNSFVAQATHELRTPLTNMRLYIEQLQDDAQADPAERAKAVNTINQECRRLERIVADMLSVSEIEAGSLRLNRGDVRMAPLLQDLQHDFEPLARAKEMSLRFELPPKLPVLKGDRDKIMLAVHNILGNAVKYTPVGGQVTLRVEESAGQLLVEVVDNGIGIREDELERIFEKFYRARDKRIGSITGSGLGLALAREVARMHGGDIVVRSQLDKGSTFTLSLPLTAPPANGAAGDKPKTRIAA